MHRKCTPYGIYVELPILLPNTPLGLRWQMGEGLAFLIRETQCRTALSDHLVVPELPISTRNDSTTLRVFLRQREESGVR